MLLTSFHLCCAASPETGRLARPACRAQCSPLERLGAWQNVSGAQRNYSPPDAREGRTPPGGGCRPPSYLAQTQHLNHEPQTASNVLSNNELRRGNVLGHRERPCDVREAVAY